jgi:plastocyanin
MNVGRPLRIIAAIALLIGGLVHLQLYFKGYRSIHTIGRSFMLNAIASGGVSALLFVRREWIVKLAGIGVAAGTIAAFIVSRQRRGLFGFHEHALHPSPQAIIALVVEITAIAALAFTFLPSVVDAPPSRTRHLAVSAATCAVVLLGFGAYWAGHYQPTAKATANTVSIANFAFAPPDLTITKGTTIVWTNADTVEHSVVAQDNSFASDTLAHSDSFHFTFVTDGTFVYHCGIHPSMAGTITVKG